MELKIFARLGAVALLSIAAASAVLEVRQNDRFATPGLVPAADLLTEELQRCSSLGPAAATDAVCREAWAENRRHFLGHRSPAPHTPPRGGAPAEGGTNSQNSAGALQPGAPPDSVNALDHGAD